VSVRVDTAPAAVEPLLGLYGYLVGCALFAYCAAQRITLRIQISGTENLAPDSSYLFCVWHGMVPLALQCSVPHLPGPLTGRSHAWMQHPLWYMKPIHVLLRLIGVRRLVLGSSGHDGRRAADELAVLLQHGYSTVIMPDGPAGPRRTLKRGVLHLAAETNLPIVPLRFAASRSVTIPTWDRKEFPAPFSTIQLQIGRPITVAQGDLELAAELLLSELGGGNPGSEGDLRRTLRRASSSGFRASSSEGWPASSRIAVAGPTRLF
jgi:lysophospholipid acyltransferase (LPLAT)-like uncharacterized protein